MLSKATTLKGYKLLCLDGEIGSVEEFYFDDLHWTIRYLVADTGHWLRARQVLISPHALGGVHAADHNITVNLSKTQIAEGPSLQNDKPVSRQFEETYHEHYGWPFYWSDVYTPGSHPYIMRQREKSRKSAKRRDVWDPHLRSSRDATGHHIQAEDGEIGHVEDFIIDDETWAIRYLIINTRNWWPGKKVLVSPQWIKRVSWDVSKIFVNLDCETIKQSPQYSDESLLTREYEINLDRHYHCTGDPPP